jgi:hypothetical protein
MEPGTAYVMLGLNLLRPRSEQGSRNHRRERP